MTARQPHIRLASPSVGSEELQAIGEVLASGTLTNGPRTTEFERAFAAIHSVDHAVAFANGTVALAAMYLGLGIGPGDEVILPSLTFISSATSILHVGATPVFGDVDQRTFNLDPADVRRRITSKTKAILTVHYGGQPGDLSALMDTAKSAGVFFLEDAAQAHGASYQGKHVGGFGKAAMFSFTPTKNITTGEGGMVTTDDPHLAKRLRLLRNHGQEALYRHRSLGYNWRMTEMQAAMGLVQIGKLPKILSRKQRNARWMSERLEALSSVSVPHNPTDRFHPYMLYTLILESGRDKVMETLVQQGIEARLYFPPAHRQPLFPHPSADLPITESLTQRMLSVPFHAHLGEEQLEEIAATLESATTSAL